MTINSSKPIQCEKKMAKIIFGILFLMIGVNGITLTLIANSYESTVITIQLISMLLIIIGAILILPIRIQDIIENNK